MKNIENMLLALYPNASVQHKDGYAECLISNDNFSPTIISLVSEHKLRLALLFATDNRDENDSYGVHAILAHDATPSGLLKISTKLSGTDPKYPSLTTHLMAAYWYERYLHDMFGITPSGHPDLRRLVHHENIPEGTFPLRKDFAWNSKLPHADVEFPMLRVKGEGIYEVPVGPIHAGIIEPGHFRFSVLGERIITLEGKLFFTHKGVEKLLEGKTPEDALPFIERISGDMAAAHALAFCHAVESARGETPSEIAGLTRAILTELERITMHIHDISNIGGMGTGFALISSRGFAIKERMVRLSQLICRNRFWRGMIIPGGVVRELTLQEIDVLFDVAKTSVKEMEGIATIALSSEAFKERLDTTGVLSKDKAIAYGALGIGARGSGVPNDARINHPYGPYKDVTANMMVRADGDIMARFMIRIDEMRESLRLIEIFTTSLRKIQNGLPVSCTHEKMSTQRVFGLGVAESWRGEIMTVVTLVNGIIERCVVRDPSFINWQLFGELAPGNILPDFPLCNKSLNLSYSGTDM